MQTDRHTQKSAGCFTDQYNPGAQRECPVGDPCSFHDRTGTGLYARDTSDAGLCGIRPSPPTMGEEPPRIELYLRSLAPDTARDEQDRVVERLRRLDERGCLRSVDVYVTGTGVCGSTAAAETDPGQFLLGRIDRFESWADEQDRSLCGFDKQCVDSSLIGETVTGITVPRIVLAEYVDGDLEFVAPSRGSAVTTVADRLDQLAARISEHP